MPELPEVEVVRMGLAEHVVGRRIDAVTVHHQRSVRRHEPGPSDFADRLTGATVVGAERRGKYLWLPIDGGDAVLAHLGMSGQMLIAGPGVEEPRHLRIAFDLEKIFFGNTKAHFDDIREIRAEFAFDTLVADGAFYAAYLVAEKLGVPVLDEAGFRRLLDGEVPAP